MDLKVKWHCNYRAPCRLHCQYSNGSFNGCSTPRKWWRSGPFGPPQKTSIFHHGAAGFLWIVKRHNPHHNTQLAPLLAPAHPDNITHLPVASKDDADVLYQQKMSHKCRPPWQPPWLWPTMVETIAAPAKVLLLHHSQTSSKGYCLWRRWVGALASASAGHVVVDDESWASGAAGKGSTAMWGFFVVIDGDSYLLWPRGTKICCTHFRGGGSRPLVAAGPSPQMPDKPRHPRVCRRRWGPRWNSTGKG